MTEVGYSGEVRYASEVAYAVKFLVSLKVKFYFRKIKDKVFSQSPSLLRRQPPLQGSPHKAQILTFTFAIAKISSCASRISSAKRISLAFMRISLHASALVGYSGVRYKDKILNAPSFRPNAVRGEISYYL